MPKHKKEKPSEPKESLDVLADDQNDNPEMEENLKDDEGKMEEKFVDLKKYPDVAGTGLFEAVPFKDGFLIYNPGGQRASDILPEAKAKDLAHANNLAAHLKPTKPQ